jgi:phosphatidylinositol alpha 1,6-mannosyltransferase
MGAAPRVAFFPDSFHEVNGLALTARALESYARHHDHPMLCVRGAGRTALHEGIDGPQTLDLARGRLAIPLDVGLAFDPCWARHLPLAAGAFDRFRPDIVHITGINDMGQLGAWLAWRRRIPLVASWHTNVHEFAGRRLFTWTPWMPRRARAVAARAVERVVWEAVARIYRMARAVLVPNLALLEDLRAVTGRPAVLMRRGVDAEAFTPVKRRREDATFRIGYVGRLAPEKNVRALACLDRRLREAGATGFEFVIVGDGSERPGLERAMPGARFTGTLRGDALAREYAGFDLFVFPSDTDTFGNVVLEALASGVPAVVTAQGGPQSVIRPDIDGLVAPCERAMADAVLRLMRDRGEHARMREAARRHALEMSWDTVFRQVYRVYDAVAGSREVGTGRSETIPKGHVLGDAP